MSEKRVKTYKAEFKESAVKLAVESDQPVTDTARDLGAMYGTKPEAGSEIQSDHFLNLCFSKPCGACLFPV